MLKRLFLSRNTISALILLTLATVTIGGFVPQAFITNPEELERWRTVYPAAARAAGLLGLHHIYTTTGFALILSAVFVSLSLSCIEQFHSSLRLMRQGDLRQGENEAFDTPLSIETVQERLRGYGFRPVGSATGISRYVRHPWGYWGKFLFHLGLVITIVASLLIALTQQRAMLKLTDGESFRPGQPWHLSERGLLASELKLGDTVRLKGVEYEFWPNAGLRRLESSLLFTPPAGEQVSRKVMINSILFHRGVRIYQDSRFGHSFHLTVTMPDGRVEQRLVELPHPTSPEQAGYGEFPNVLAQGTVLRLKYVVNDTRTSFVPANPTLSLRIDAGKTPLGTLSLKQGQEGSVGPYRFRLVSYGTWSQLIFVKLFGIEAVFLGFIVICGGGILHYFTPPREVTVRTAPGSGCLVGWRAARFADFYRDELELLRQGLCLEEHRE